MTGLLQILEKHHLLHPKVLNRKGDLRYLSKCITIILITAFVGLRYTIGGFSPSIGLMIGNYFNIYGVAGQVMSLGAGICVVLTPYFRLRLFRQSDGLSFLSDLVDCGDSKQKSVLTGDYRTRFITFTDQILKICKPASQLLAADITLTVCVIGIIIPVVIQGVSIGNVLYWSLSFVPVPVLTYHFGVDTIYVLGSIWFLSKYHLDLQTDFVVEKMEDFLKLAELRDAHVFYLDIIFKRLLSRVKEFDRLSKDLISPCRLVMSYSMAIIIFATSQQSNLLLQIILSGTCSIVYVLFLSFLSTACSLSIRRKKMYILANQLFVKSSQRSKSLRQLIILRRLVKSLGNDIRPTICLTEQSGEEFKPMEFLEFVSNTFTNFTLVAKVFRVHLK